MFKASNLSINESAITGENDDVKKRVPETYEPSERANPFLISGSKVMDGSGDVLVLAVGDNSQWG